ncbi:MULTISPECIES: type II toxin-antitoxin system VapC family toxin [Pectobacterium]|uniref:Type II toxin-antitoxin system VapC family toxin n=4 Tax=Pectobacteriaceae TaxID=1903410 RepID=A0AA93ALI3_9GAMM|nr:MULTISPECIES: type II toxin-antitoxin system VapC family toxin [Pectobacterium]PLY38554.1 twitching motility protein PilT [Pectobacterium carotovorum]MBE5201793.1 type II toxin-antitoxin system VapC family toxin [Pectobacterium quasiaquaticum]MBE5210108.1 type II toxin-antitoxin system VapC family toxin [Pectobacterium quasiaquaticum]MBN3050219.1 type II toxin-antitoxin system VapC family toxin [Pectobacterium brasiliense]MBN3074137.1 type II toxin-antitoxin system VapC family toxin [Pectob
MMTINKDDAPKQRSTSYLLDTHALIWLAGEPENLSSDTIAILSDDNNRFYFSSVSIQEIAIKTALNKPSFSIDAEAITKGLLSAGYLELPMQATHAYNLTRLPEMHQDPFDRILVSQAKIEGLALITNDGNIIKYCSGYISVIKCC